MKKTIVAGLCLSLAALFSVQAQNAGKNAIGVTAKRTQVKAYSDAEGKQKTTPISTASIAFPLQIYEQSSAGYIRVKVANQSVWLDPDELVIDTTLQAKCLVSSDKGVAPMAGGLRGANEGCK